MRNKEKDKIIEIEPFKIKSSSKKQSKEDRPIKNILQSISLEYENNDILNFNLHVDFTKKELYIEEVGNLEPVSRKGDSMWLKEVENGKGSYKAIDYKNKSFFLTLSATCPKCQHNELLIEDYEGIHSTLRDLEDNIGDKFLYRDEGTAVISKFSVKAKIGDEYDGYFDISVKCFKCSHEIFWDLFEDTYGEICDKIEHFKVNLCMTRELLENSPLS